MDFLDDLEYRDITKDQLLRLVPENYSHTFIIVVDRIAVSLPDFPPLIVDLYDGSGGEFRAIPPRIQSIQNKLTFANTVFDEGPKHPCCT